MKRKIIKKYGQKYRPVEQDKQLIKPITPSVIAKQLGISAVSVWNWFHGRRTPRLKHLYETAKILKVPPEELMEHLDKARMDYENSKI